MVQPAKKFKYAHHPDFGLLKGVIQELAQDRPSFNGGGPGIPSDIGVQLAVQSYDLGTAVAARVHVRILTVPAGKGVR